MIAQAILDRFWGMVEWERRDRECWWWSGRGSNGRAMFRIHGRGKSRVVVYAYRMAYQIIRGPIPKGKQINHTCDNPMCVNPDHLYVGTQADNIRDCWKRIRHPKLRAIPLALGEYR